MEYHMKRITPYVPILALFWITCLNAALVDHYIGCYSERAEDERELNIYVGWSNTMTASYCIKRCVDFNSTFAALQKGDECWCGDNFGVHGRVHAGECRRTCIGDPEQWCGGDEGYTSIYSVCPMGIWSLPHCYRECTGCGGWYCKAASGECVGRCQGTNCTINSTDNSTEVVTIPDHCATDNGGCHHNCRNTLDGPQCFCDPGYELAEGNACIDTNECNLALGGCEHICTNEIGLGYTCSCETGYRLEGNYACKDIDECATQEADCPQYCINTEGSYTCKCRAGFETLSEKNCSDACTKEFRLIYPRDRAVSSGCVDVASPIRANRTMCKQMACEENVNAFTFRDNECHIKFCRDSYMVTTVEGAWEVWAINGSVEIPVPTPQTTTKPPPTTPTPDAESSSTASPLPVGDTETSPAGGFQMWMIGVIIGAIALIAIVAVVVFIVLKKRKKANQFDEGSIANGEVNKGYDDLDAYAAQYRGRAGKKKGDSRITLTDGMDIETVNKQSYPHLGVTGTIRNKTLHKDSVQYEDMIVAS